MTRPDAVSEDEWIQLNALADDEIDPALAEALRARIAKEPALRAAYGNVLAVRDAVRGLAHARPSQEFLHRIDAATNRPAAAGPKPMTPSHAPSWLSFAASVCIAAGLGSAVTLAVTSGSQETFAEARIADSHRRGLLAASPVDIASSNRHTVKPWLDARLGVSPPTVELATQGFPLIGGRVEVLEATPAPALVYRHNEHLITLFAIAGPEATSEPREFAANGYNMVHWKGAGYTFWAVSDLEGAELARFVSVYRDATQAQ